jgi:acyl-coenzyme A thioesterase PaaI-like protein
MQLIKRYSNCFVCGDKNRCGLKVDFFDQDGVARAQYEASGDFEGYKDILHGGIISALLDEVMIKSILARDILAVTASIEVRFKQPIKTGERLSLEGRIVEDKGKVITTEGKVLKEDNTVAALGFARYVKADQRMKTVLEQSLES